MKNGIITKIEIGIHYGTPVLSLEIDRGRAWSSNGNSRYLRLIYSLKFPKKLPTFIQMLNRLTSRLEEQQESISRRPSD